jgi:hypothetical protein
METYIYFSDLNKGEIVTTKDVTKCEKLNEYQKQIKIFQDSDLWKVAIFSPHG